MALALATTACGGRDEQPQEPPRAEHHTQPRSTDLKVSLDRDGSNGPAKPEPIVLRCPRPTGRCSGERLESFSAADLARPGAASPCARIYDHATITAFGTLFSKTADLVIAHAPGCDRWGTAVALLRAVRARVRR